ADAAALPRAGADEGTSLPVDPRAGGVAGLRHLADALHRSRCTHAGAARRPVGADERARRAVVHVVTGRVAEERLQTLPPLRPWAAVGADTGEARRARLPIDERARRVARLRDVAIALQRPGHAIAGAHPARAQERTRRAAVDAGVVGPMPRRIANLRLLDVAT